MQLELTAVISAFATLISIAAMIILALGSAAIKNREREIDRRLDEARLESKTIDTRLHAEEKATIRQDGEIKLVQQNHTGLQGAIDEVRRTMVTKSEWTQLEKTLDKLATSVERKYPFASPSQYPSRTMAPPKREGT